MGFLPGLLPLLISSLGLSLTLAGLTVSVINFVANLLQPVFGYLGDRAGRRLLVVVGPVLTAVSMSCLGLVGTYPMLLVALILGGLGNAVFHPVAASFTGTLSRGRSRVMALFIAGGTIGYGAGPMIIIAFVSVFGMARTWVTAVVGIACAVFLLTSIPRATDAPAARSQPGVAFASPGWLFPLVLLYLVVTLRAGCAMTFTTFVPILMQRRGETLMLGGFALLTFSVAGAIGGIIAGHLAARIARKWITAVSLALASGWFLLFLHTPGALASTVVPLFGMCLFAALPLNIVTAQELVPGRASAASGLVMGSAWAVGSLAAGGVGALADRLAVSLDGASALSGAMQWAVLLPAIGAAVSCVCPTDRSAAAADSP